jgi:CheY-like chemotaxis protein
LFVSASLDPTNLARVREAGVEEVLDKFAAPEEIIGAIRRLEKWLALLTGVGGCTLSSPLVNFF